MSLEGLGPVYARAIAYLEGQRGGATRPLRYEVVWLDNGSSEDGRDGFRRRRPQLEATLLEPRNISPRISAALHAASARVAAARKAASTSVVASAPGAIRGTASVGRGGVGTDVMPP